MWKAGSTYGSPLELLGNGFGMWGPVIYLRGSRRIVGVHVYPGRVLLLYPDEKKKELLNVADSGLMIERIGIELDLSKKAAEEGMIYSAAMFDLRGLAERYNASEYGYAVRVDGLQSRIQPGTVVAFGGERRVAAINSLEGDDAQLLEQLVPREKEKGEL
ncbi:MAG: type III-B CRISPR module-associated Cmr3 family protein, partial [Nitrososphaeria archaeon]